MYLSSETFFFKHKKGQQKCKGSGRFDLVFVKLIIFAEILNPVLKFLYENGKQSCIFAAVHRVV